MHAATFSVTEVACDAAPGGYEWALQQANSTPGRDTISIDIPVFQVDCFRPTAEPDLPTPITESVDIVGNGNLVNGNVFYVDQSGGANNPSVCPNFDSGARFLDAGGALLQIGDFGVDNSGVEVTVTNLKTTRLTRFAFVHENGKLTVEDVEIAKTVGVTTSGTCNLATIAAKPGADVTLKNTTITQTSIPEKNFAPIPGVEFLATVIAGLDARLTMDNVKITNTFGDFTGALLWQQRSRDATINIVSSEFQDSGGFLIDGANVFFFNSAYQLSDLGRAYFKDNIIPFNGARFLSQASTFNLGSGRCGNCVNPSDPRSTTGKALGFYVPTRAGLPDPIVNFQESALGRQTAVVPDLQMLAGDPSLFSSDTDTWVQPSAAQTASEIASFLPVAITAVPGLPESPSNLQTQRTPVVPGVLVEAVSAVPGNVLRSPIPPFDVITEDINGQPRLYANGTRNIGAVQNVDAPPLSASAGDAEVLLTWSATPDGQQNGYEICSTTTVLTDPLIGSCPTAVIPVGGSVVRATIQGLTNGDLYYFAIRAPGGIWSRVATATPLGPLGAPQITAVTTGDGLLQVDWIPPADLGGHPGPLLYSTLYRPTGSTNWLSGTQTAATTAQQTGLINGTRYEIGVWALAADGAISPIAQGTGTPTAPPILSYASPGNWPQNTPLTLTPTVTPLQGVAVYGVEAGALPNGMTIDPNTGVISGTPITQQSTSATIRLIDTGTGKLADAILDLSIVAPAPDPQLWYPSVQATVGVGPVSATPTQSNIPAGATFSVLAGESLPDGFSIDPATGVVSGTPTSAPGRVVDVDIEACWGGCDPNAGEVRVAPMLFYILPALQYPAVTTATAGVATSIAPTVNLWSGGVFSITSGTLPAGMTLDANTGVISGTPQSVVDAPLTLSYTTGVNVAGLESITSATEIIVAAPTITLTYPSVTGTVGENLTVTPTVTGISGTAVYSLVSGALPPGLSLNPSTGAITGVPSGTPGNVSVVIEVTDTYGNERAGVVIELLAATAPAVPVPTLSLPALALLAILMTLMGGWARRQYRVRR